MKAKLRQTATIVVALAAIVLFHGFTAQADEFDLIEDEMSALPPLAVGEISAIPYGCVALRQRGGSC